jgi:dephospho-CoA kinase
MGERRMDVSHPPGSERPYVIGLTGNIATGKSLVGQMLVELGAEHVDADLLAHETMAPGTPAYGEILAAFGREILGPGGEIDRRRLGQIVFADLDALARLEQIVHPRVIARVEQWIAASEAQVSVSEASAAPVAVVEAIKLIESGMVRRLCDALWVVTAPRWVQLERLMTSRGLSRAEALLRIDAQPSQALKVAQADVVIDNGGTIEATRCQVERAWARLVLQRNRSWT